MSGIEHKDEPFTCRCGREVTWSYDFQNLNGRLCVECIKKAGEEWMAMSKEEREAEFTQMTRPKQKSSDP